MTSYSLHLKVPPYVYEGNGLFQFPDLSTEFWIEKIKWTYSYRDIGIPSAKISPLKPIVVSIGNFFAGEKAPIIKNPFYVKGFVDYQVRNTNLENNHQLILQIELEGTHKKSCQCSTQTLMTKGCHCGGK